MNLAFEIPSTFEAARQVQQSVMELVLSHNYDADSAFAIRLALEEGLTNAIKHGNRLDPAKKVRVKAKVTSETTEVTIEDEGTGFTRSTVPDPTSVDNLGRPHGRGILLIESYMTHAKWDQGGRRLHMGRDNTPLDIHRNRPSAEIS